MALVQAKEDGAGGAAEKWLRLPLKPCPPRVWTGREQFIVLHSYIWETDRSSAGTVEMGIRLPAKCPIAYKMDSPGQSHP